MIIGLVGMMASGKGEIVKILEDLGFKYVRLSSMVREEARKLGLSEERSVLQDVGNKMRAEGGVGILAQRAMEKIEVEGGDWVVDGVRNDGEVDVLQEKGAVVVGVEVDREILIERLIGRGRDGDASERVEIEAKLDREWGIGEPEDGQQVGKCMQKADFVIKNEGTLIELRTNFLNLLDSHG
jgi:dephospho-CoA kinase